VDLGGTWGVRPIQLVTLEDHTGAFGRGKWLDRGEQWIASGCNKFITEVFRTLSSLRKGVMCGSDSHWPSRRQFNRYTQVNTLKAFHSWDISRKYRSDRSKWVSSTFIALHFIFEEISDTRYLKKLNVQKNLKTWSPSSILRHPRRAGPLHWPPAYSNNDTFFLYVFLYFYVYFFKGTFCQRNFCNLLPSAMHVEESHFDLALRYFLLIFHEWKALRLFACVYLLNWRREGQCESDPHIGPLRHRLKSAEDFCIKIIAARSDSLLATI